MYSVGFNGKKVSTALQVVLITLLVGLFTAGIGAAETHITALPYDITSPGYYVLDTGCTNVGWDYAINIASSDVVLDGNGYVLDGDDSGTPVKKKYGILVKGVDNVIILNVEVTDWVAGIYLNSVRAGEVVNCNLNSNSYAGIYLYESSKNKLNNNIIRSNTYGIRLESSCSNNIIFLNNFEDNTFNIRDKGSNRWYSLEPLSYTYNGVNYTRYLGNYYSDYTGTDADGDGIGDIPYGNDAYPLMESPASQESTIEEGVASNVARSVISEVSQKLPAFQLHLALLGLLVATYILRKCRR
jgi:parallel beta-helix repeat protein